ncbi:MAG: hypothetical protein ACRCV5_15830 [Afipia sp.]
MYAKTLYKRDLVISVDGKVAEGVVTVPLKDKYKIEVESKIDLVKFFANTCTKEMEKDKMWRTTKTVPDGWFGWGSKTIEDPRKVSFEYSPNDSLERQGGCPMELTGIDGLGRYAFGLIEFVGPDTTLPGRMECNGVTTDFVGAIACQAREGLIQSFTFKVPVVISPDPGCEVGQPDANGRWQFPINKKKCMYAIVEKAQPRREARITMYGYESVLVRSEEKAVKDGN